VTAGGEADGEVLGIEEHRGVGAPPGLVPSALAEASFAAFCKRQGLDPRSAESCYAAAKQHEPGVVLAGAGLALRRLLTNDGYLKRLEEEVDAAVAGSELEDTLLVLGLLREMVVHPGAGERRLDAIHELRRWYAGSRAHRFRRRVLDEQRRGVGGPVDVLGDLGRELLQGRRGVQAEEEK